MQINKFTLLSVYILMNETNNNSRSIFDQEKYYSKLNARIEYSPHYNPSKECYFRGVYMQDGSYADLD